MRYRCTFPAGFGEPAAEAAARDVPGCRISDGDDSSFILETDRPFGIPSYLQGVALLAASAAADAHGPTLEDACRRYGSRGDPRADAALAGAAAEAARRLGRKARTFALRTFEHGSPAAAPRSERAALERRIIDLTGLRPESRRSDLDFQLHLRADGRSYLAIPLRQGGPEPELLRGELPRHTATLLCELSRPDRRDVFLDPFMGSGAIPLARARMGAYRMIFAGDSDAAAVEAFIGRLGGPGLEKKRRTIFPKHLDATDLSRFDEGFFTAVVTDPPWGEYTAAGAPDAGELRGLYAAFLREARRVTAAGGRLVLLTGRNVPLDEALEDSGAEWKIERDFRVLISGKKARVTLFL